MPPAEQPCAVVVLTPENPEAVEAEATLSALAVELVIKVDLLDFELFSFPDCVSSSESLLSPKKQI